MPDEITFALQLGAALFGAYFTGMLAGMTLAHWLWRGGAGLRGKRAREGSGMQ